MTEPTNGLQQFQSVKRVLAGEITEVVEAGAYVTDEDGTSILRLFPENMTARYTPVPGDVWIVYPDGYQSISPRAAFLEGYVPVEDAPATIRAKFCCSYPAPYADGGIHVYMHAVYSDKPNSENKKFSDATPNGQFQMSIKAGGPTAFFVSGEEYYLDFTKAPKGA